MPLETTDGKLVDVEAAQQQFAQAMAAPAAEDPVAAAPPRKAPADPGAKPRGKTADDKPRTRTRTTPSPGKAAESAQAASQRRAEGITGLFQLGAGMALVMDQRTPEGDIAWRADAVTLANAADPVGKAVADAAASNAEFAAIVDKVTKVGPWGGLISIGLSLGSQIARNHGMKMAESFGAVPPEMLLSSLDQDQPKAA